MLLGCLIAALGVIGCGAHEQATTQIRTEITVPRASEIRSGTALETFSKQVKLYRFPRDVDRAGWQFTRQNCDATRAIDFHVPWSWNVSAKRAESADGLIIARAFRTSIDEDKISLAGYVAELAGSKPVTTKRMPSGLRVYFVTKRVSVTPENPSAAAQTIHTAIYRSDGAVCKLDVRYDAKYTWRFNSLATAIVGTINAENTSAGEALG